MLFYKEILLQIPKDGLRIRRIKAKPALAKPAPARCNRGFGPSVVIHCDRAVLARAMTCLQAIG
jgi:hypothetical protein